MISTIAKLLHLPAYSIDEKTEAIGAMREGHYLVREDDVKGVVVRLRREYDALRKQHRAEVLAFGERVRRKCADAGCNMADYHNILAVDVARLLEEDAKP